VHITFHFVTLHGIHRITETTTVDYHGGINEHMLTPISSTFYTVTLIIYDDWIPTPIKLKMLLKRISGATINTLCSIGGYKGGGQRGYALQLDLNMPKGGALFCAHR